MNNDTALKEYYVNLQKMYNKAANMLSAINQSLTTSSPEIVVNVADSDDATSMVRIPSYLYLESRLEELGTNMEAIFNIPEDGEAWFSKSDSTIKLNLVRSGTAPISPEISTTDVFASITDNNILKDLVFPKTYLKLNLENIPTNIEEMFMKKVVINSGEYFRAILKASVNGKISYANLKTLLYTLKKGVDYDEYDSTIKLPIKKDHYVSNFRIVEVISQDKIKVDTVIYNNEEDSAITYTLSAGDYICLGNAMVVYEVTDVLPDNTLRLKKHIGYATLETFEQNSEMVFQIYQENYDEYNYAQVPLEENQYIVVFLSTVWNNVRSVMSDGYVVDLSTILMRDANGRAITDTYGNQYNYLSYYKEYCTNLGDLILGMSRCAYSQVSNYTPDELNNLLNSDEAKLAVSKSFNTDGILKVVAINKHLVDDAATKDIVNLHTQKNEISAKLQTCQANIDQVYSTMLTTDFSQNVTVTQASLQEKIQGYYSERTLLQKQLNAVIDNINVKADSMYSSDSATKYRIRGVSNTNILDEYLKKFNNVQVIGIDIEYKYKTTSKDTATLTTINGATFTDWNKQFSIDKERRLVFANGGYSLQFVDYSNIVNTIKWNQFDIPIKNGEDVVIRVRYKYSVGQPFINLYSPWSDEYTVIFPAEFTENVEISSILETNSKDTVTATFNKTLIDEGYTEHIQNKVLSNEQVFFHMPENIYSGFNTAENNLISLKDKLQDMVNTIEKYRQYIEGLSNTSFEVYLNYDDNSVLLSPNSINKINIYNTDHITDMFIKKEMNIIIKNTGSTRLNLYSIFPGNIDEHLITNATDSYIDRKGDYERVPVFIANELEGQYLGQWIYFRQNNPFSRQNIYYDTIVQNAYDFRTEIKKSKLVGKTNDDGTLEYTPGSKILNFHKSFVDYIGKDNTQVLLGFRNNRYISGFDYTSIIDSNVDIEKLAEDGTVSNIDKVLEKFNTYIYKEYNVLSSSNSSKTYLNQYILRYEDIIVSDNTDSRYLDDKTSLTEVMNKVKYSSVSGEANSKNTMSVSSTEQFVGGFLYPNLLSKAQILTSGGEQASKTIDMGSSLSIPIVFEYYVESGKSTITKSLYFDLRNSLISDPLHYMIEVTGNYDYTTTGEIYTDIDDIIS